MDLHFVFSHARRDDARLESLFGHLQDAVRERLGLQTAIGVGFRDPELPWHPGVASAVARCSVHVVVLSPAFAESVDCGRRLTLAMLRRDQGGGRPFIVPLLLAPTRGVPDGLDDGLTRIDRTLRRGSRSPDHPDYRALVDRVADDIARIVSQGSVPRLSPAPQTLDGVANAFGERPRRAARVTARAPRRSLAERVDRLPLAWMAMLGLGVGAGLALGAVALWTVTPDTWLTLAQQVPLPVGPTGLRTGVLGAANVFAIGTVLGLVGLSFTGRPVPVEESAGFFGSRGTQVLGVLAILVGGGALAAVLVGRGDVGSGQAPTSDVERQVASTLHTMSALDAEVKDFILRNRRAPSSLQELMGQGDVPEDAWGNAISYRASGIEYELVSLGSDGKEGGTGSASDIPYRSPPAAGDQRSEAAQ